MSDDEIIIKGLEGVIMNYRRGRHTQHPRHLLLKFNEFNSRRESGKLIGRVVGWQSKSGKILRGKIVDVHGKKGAVRAIFPVSVPGTAIGERIKILN